MDDREQRIRERAYRIWEDEGRPEGGHDDHWRRAEEHHDASDASDAADATEENWKVEAGLPEDKPQPPIALTTIPPD